VTSPLTSRAAADDGENVDLSCEVSAVPNATFAWRRVGGDAVVAGHNDKFSIRTVVKDLTRSISLLTISDLSAKDYADYECVARNSEGSARTRVTLGPRSAPEPPSKVTVDNVTHESSVINWQPGFHGGMDQFFRYV